MDILSRQFDNQHVTIFSPHYLYKWNIRLEAVFSGKNALFQGKNVVGRDNKKKEGMLAPPTFPSIMVLELSYLTTILCPFRI